MNQPSYQDEAVRTLSTAFHRHLVEHDELSEAVVDLEEAGQRLDAIKKALFYGIAPRRSTPAARPLPRPEHAYSEVVLHGAIGLVTEAIELLLSVWRHIDTGDDLDEENVFEELGDLEWYAAVLRYAMNWTQESVQQANLRKLAARYKGGAFTREEAAHRDTAHEMQALAAPTRTTTDP